MHQQKNILLKGVTWKLLLFVSAFLLNIFIANIFGATESGAFFYIINNLTLIIQFLGLGLDTSLGYFNSKKEHTSSYLLNIAISWSLITSILFSLFFFIGHNYELFENKNNSLLLIIFVFSSLLNGMVSILYISSNRNILPNLLPTVINVSLIAYLYFFIRNNQNPDWQHFLKAYLLAPAFSCIILVSGKIYKERIKFSLQQIKLSKKLFSYSLQIFIFNLLINLLLRSDIWLVKSLTNADDLGNYIQTGKMVQLVLLLPNLASFILLPLLTQQRQNRELVKENVLKLCNVYFYSSLLLCGFFAASGYWLFPFLFGSSFTEMYPTFILIIPGVVLFSTAYPIDSYFSSIDRNTENIKATICALAIMLMIDLLLIPHFSIYGAAIGSAVAYITFFFYIVNRFKHYTSISLLYIFSRKTFQKTVLVPIKHQLKSISNKN